MSDNTANRLQTAKARRAALVTHLGIGHLGKPPEVSSVEDRAFADYTKLAGMVLELMAVTPSNEDETTWATALADECRALNDTIADYTNAIGTRDTYKTFAHLHPDKNAVLAQFDDAYGWTPRHHSRRPVMPKTTLAAYPLPLPTLPPVPAEHKRWFLAVSYINGGAGGSWGNGETPEVALSKIPKHERTNHVLRYVDSPVGKEPPVVSGMNTVAYGFLTAIAGMHRGKPLPQSTLGSM